MASWKSHIHPSFRTGVAAWLVSRAALWTAAYLAPGRLFAAANPFAAIDARGFERGAPAWSALAHMIQWADGVVPAALGASGGQLVLAGLGELAMLVALVAVYRFVRRDNLPQTAERATWLWACAPLAAWTIPAGAWVFALAAAALALAAAGAGLALRSSAAIVVAILFRPEALLLAPGLIYLGWTRRGGSPEPYWAPWALTLAPVLAFIGAVGSAILLAGSYGVSLRTLQPDAAWRQDLEWRGLDAHLPELALAAGAVVLFASLVRELRDVHPSWALAAMPCLLWPFLQEPSTATMPALLLSIPAFGALARVVEDPSRERVVFGLSFAAMILLAYARW